MLNKLVSQELTPLRDLEDWMLGVIAILANVIFAGLWFLIYNGLN